MATGTRISVLAWSRRGQIVDLLNIRVDLSRSSGALGMAETARSRQYAVSSCRQQPGTKGECGPPEADKCQTTIFRVLSCVSWAFRPRMKLA